MIAAHALERLPGSLRVREYTDRGIPDTVTITLYICTCTTLLTVASPPMVHLHGLTLSSRRRNRHSGAMAHLHPRLRLRLCKPPLLLLHHLPLYLHAHRHNLAPRRCDLKRKALAPERAQRLALDERVLRRIVSVEAKRRAQRDGRVRDHARHARVVLRGRVQHERVQQHNVADVARELDYVLAAQRARELQHREVARVVRVVCARRVRRRKRAARRQDALGVRGEVARDGIDAGWRDACAAAARRDVGEERDDEQRLLGRVEEVHEEVAVDVPVVERARVRRRLALECVRPEVDNKRVAPCRALLVNALDATQKVEYCAPRLRLPSAAETARTQGEPHLGRELTDRLAPVRRHVRALARPRRLVKRVHPEPDPHLARKVIRAVAAKRVLDHDVAVA
jgi:hypothetical protein